MHLIDYLIVIAYLLMTVALGVWFGRGQSRREFFMARGSMGRMAVGLSVMATLFSSNSFVMYPSAAYGNSLRLGLTLVAHTLIAPLVIWVFIPVYRRLGCQTAYEYLERRFHWSVRCLASGLFVLLRIGWMAAATFAASLVIAGVSGIDQIAVILGLGSVAVLYTMLGGLRAVMWTDVIQFFIFSITILISLGLLVSFQSGGISGMFESYFDGRPKMLFDFEPSMTLKFGSWAILIGIFLEALSAFGADQVAVQRYIAAESEKTSQIGFVISLVGLWVVVPALLLIGVGLYSYFRDRPQELVPLLVEQQADGAAPHTAEYYKAHPEQVAADMKRLKLQDKAMPTFVSLHFPPGVTGLFLVALMAAIMSSIDSGIHSVTTALVVDFRDRLFPQWKPASDTGDVQMIRIIIFAVGAIAVTLACFVGPLGDVFDIAKKLTAAFGGPLLAVFILALFFRRATSPGVFLGALSAAGATITLMYFRSDWFSVWFWPVGFGLAIGLSVVFSLVTPRRKGQAEAEPLDFKRVMRESRENE